MAACECYIAMLEMEDHQQTMCIGEQRTTMKPVEELEEITLDDSRSLSTANHQGRNIPCGQLFVRL